MAIIAAAAVAGKTAAIGEITGAIEGAISDVFGPTATDKRRVASADALLERALAGDDAAVVALCYEAFERRNGSPGDPRTPVDGKFSPQDVRDLALDRLKRYVRARGGLPQAASQWAAKLSTAVLVPRPATIGEQLIGAVERGVTSGTQAAAEERITTAAKAAQPWVILGIAAVAIAAGLYLGTRK